MKLSKKKIYTPEDGHANVNILTLDKASEKIYACYILAINPEVHYWSALDLLSSDFKHICDTDFNYEDKTATIYFPINKMESVNTYLKSLKKLGIFPPKEETKED